MILEAKDIVKTYDKGRVEALKGISFAVGEGEIFGLIGPDGAGRLRSSAFSPP